MKLEKKKVTKEVTFIDGKEVIRENQFVYLNAENDTAYIVINGLVQCAIFGLEHGQLEVVKSVIKENKNA